jgi:hypothetical protein
MLLFHEEASESQAGMGFATIGFTSKGEQVFERSTRQVKLGKADIKHNGMMARS